MTSPNQKPPPGAYVIGDGGGDYSYGQNMTEAIGMQIMTRGAKTSIGNAGSVHRTEVSDRISKVQTKADTAVTEAAAAANKAATAESTAASASTRASYWEAEFVVASAAVVLGVNELLIGLCQNVPGGLTRTITDMHVALSSQPNGMTFELKKWDATGTAASVLGTYNLAANVTRANWPNLGLVMASRERVFINVTSVTGSVAPVVLQVLLFGVMQ